MKFPVTNILLMLLGASLCAASNAGIEVNQAAQIGQTNCATFDATTEKALYSLREYMLVPGARMDFEKIIASPELQKVRRAEEERKSSDWAYLCRYKNENAMLRKQGTKPRVIFIGDSITENWRQADSAYFSGTNVNRGIGGQTSSQALLRFYADVVSLHPDVVHIMIGTNDIAENTGRIDDEDYQNNIRAMTDLATANRIKVVLGAIPPANTFVWRPEVRPSERILSLNRWLKQFAGEHGFVYADYYAPLANAEGGLKSQLGNDGVHPNRSGYKLMREVAIQAIERSEN